MRRKAYYIFKYFNFHTNCNLLWGSTKYFKSQTWSAHILSKFTVSSKCIHVSGTMVSVIRSDLAFLWKFKTFQLVLSSLVYAEQVSNGLIDDLHLLTFNNDISWSTVSLLIGRHMISGAEQFHTWTCAIFMGCIFVLFYMWVLIS